MPFGVCFVIGGALNYMVQIHVSRIQKTSGKDFGKIHYRVKTGGSDFSDVAWTEAYDENILTDSTTLSSLATALGVTLNKRENVSSSNPVTVATIPQGHSAIISIVGYSWNITYSVIRRIGSDIVTTVILDGGALPEGVFYSWNASNSAFIIESTSPYSLAYGAIVL